MNCHFPFTLHLLENWWYFWRIHRVLVPISINKSCFCVFSFSTRVFHAFMVCHSSKTIYRNGGFIFHPVRHRTIGLIKQWTIYGSAKKNSFRVFLSFAEFNWISIWGTVFLSKKNIVEWKKIIIKKVYKSFIWRRFSEKIEILNGP